MENSYENKIPGCIVFYSLYFLYNLSANADSFPTVEAIKISCNTEKLEPIKLNKEMLEETMRFYIKHPRESVDDKYKSYVLNELNTQGYDAILKEINDQKKALNQRKLADIIEDHIWQLGNSWDTALAISETILLIQNEYGAGNGTCVCAASNLTSNFIVPSDKRLWLEERLKGAKYRGSQFKSNIAGDPIKGGELISCEYVLSNTKEISLASEKQSTKYNNIPIVAHAKLDSNYHNNWHAIQKAKPDNNSYYCKSTDVNDCKFNEVK